MKIRKVVHLILMLGIVLWSMLGSFVTVEQDYLASLFSNVRDKLQIDDKTLSDEVVFVEFSESDKDEFSQWPPAPLDYIVVLKRVLAADPAMVVFPDAVHWQPGVEFLDAFKEGLLPFSRTVLGFSLDETGKSLSEDGLVFALGDIPKVTGVFRDTSLLPKVKQAKDVPQANIRSTLDMGFSVISDASREEGPWLAANFNDEFVVPSLINQVITLYRRVPYLQQSVNLGRNATWNLSNTYLLPLSTDGKIQLPGLMQVQKVSALDFMIPDLGDEEALAKNKILGKNKIVVLGQTALKTDKNSVKAYQQAQWIATALMIPAVQASAKWVNVLVIFLTLGFAWKQLSYARGSALFYGLLALGVGYAIAVMVFQTRQVWWSPAGWLILAASTAFCILWKKEDEELGSVKSTHSDGELGKMKQAADPRVEETDQRTPEIADENKESASYKPEDKTSSESTDKKS